MPKLAFDRFAHADDSKSSRSFDDEGRMQVANCPISKATVNEYYGREIPDHENLGLKADAIYRLLRDPKELEKAADSFNGIQLLEEHVPVNADEPRKKIVAGCTGTDTHFDGEYLVTTITVWPQYVIDLIEGREKEQLSASYAYEAVMEKGTFKGLPYDGRMVNIRGNHVAFVEQGRAGPDVRVSDALPKGLMMKRKAFNRVIDRVNARYAQDSNISGEELIRLITEAMPKDDDDDAEDNEINDDPNVMDSMIPGKAMDYLKDKLSKDEMREFADYCKEGTKADDEDMDDAEDEEDEEDEEEKRRKLRSEDEEDEDEEDEEERRKLRNGDRKARDKMRASDAATIEKRLIRRMAEWGRACEKVRPHIGRVKIAMDQAPDGAATLYRRALKHAGVSTDGITQVRALERMVDLLPAEAGQPVYASDSSGHDPLKEVLAGAVNSYKG